MDIALPPFRRAVAALAALLIAFGCVGAAASTAFAQSAGDEQYADPLGDGGGDSGESGDQPTSSDDGSSGTADSPSATTAPTEPAAPAAAESASTLPRTGVESPLLAALGLTLLAGGALLRRTARPT
jgi:LPXTG-motif cell wall-anchored protein